MPARPPDLQLDTDGRPMPRRDFLRILAAAGASGVVASILGRPRGARAAGLPPDWIASFPDGVKAGDPGPRRAAIWTRVARPPGGEPVPVLWTVAEDEAMERVVRGGVAFAGDARGHVLTVQVRHLAADRWYHYRFEAPGAVSP